MWKRILSCILAASLILTMLPEAAFAKTSKLLYGDVNNDGDINLEDPLTLVRYIAEEDPADFNFENADVNVDKKVDMEDLLLLKMHLAEWDVRLGPEIVTVSFYDGDRLIDTLLADKGKPLGETPSIEKTSKASGIFAGWYTDKDFTEPFYAENPVNESMSVYAKYDAVKGIDEVLTIDSFAKTDVETNYTLTIKGEGEEADALAALNLIVKDGSEPPVLKVKDNGNGTYTVTAEGGFRAGSSYELELSDSFHFVGESGELPETVRKACFTVKKEIVDTLQLSDDIRNIKDTAEIKYSMVDSDDDKQYDDTVDELTSNISINPGGSIATVSGADKMKLHAGDIICFYVGTDPDKREYTGSNASAYVGEPTTYVKIVEIKTNEIVFTSLAEEDLSNIYDIPDVFPIKDVAKNNKTNIEKLDISVYEQYGIETPTLNFAKTKITAGDYVAVYENTPKDDQQNDITYGKITDYNKSTGDIKFEICTAGDIVSSRSMYVQPAIEGDKLITEKEKKEIEATMLSQIQESGFAEEAAYALAELSTKTDGFKNMKNLRSVMLRDESGKPLTDEEIKLLNIGASFELKDGITLSVELITKGKDLHFNGGVQLAVKIEAEFEVEAEEGKVVIDLNATFIEELAIRPTVDGSLTYKRILGIPIPNGVRVAANIDVMNYTAYDFDVTAYTVAEEDNSLWDSLKKLAKDPTSITTVLGESGLIPPKYADQLTTVSDVFKKIEEVEKKISDAKTKYDESKEKVEDLKSDLGDLKELAEALLDKGACDGLSKEDWKNAATALSKTNIAQELLHLTDDGIDFDGDAGVDNDVNIKSVDELMEKYSEMLEKETDWVKLLDKTICEANAGIYIVNLSLKVDFIIRTNMSIALGSTLEYETGKRYTFWFQFGLYKPTAGSSNMDLIDESLVFQFYVMGKLEIKMGAKITIGANIGSSDVVSVGIYAEVGPYVKLYGFFIYTYERMREANTLTSVKKEQKMGALFLETGIYLIVGVEASALKGIFEVSYDFANKEFPILKAGCNEFPYAFSYEPQEDEKIVIRDHDSDSSNGITMTLSDQLRAIRVMTLTSGKSFEKIYDYSDYNISFSNPNFSLNTETGEISVTVPDGIRLMNCEMRLTYKYGKMAFSDYDIGASIPLCWTNLTDQELSEYYTASVRVGNAKDGYKTVWSKRILKNEAFELPTEDEIQKLIGYSDFKYTSGGYAKTYDTTNGIIGDTVYDYNVTFKEYNLTVTGIEGANPVQTFTAKFGETFDFSALATTGTNDTVNGKYTIFQNVTTDAEILVGKDKYGNDIYETINLASPISERTAQALETGSVRATANYVDNSVKAVFAFHGLLKHADVEQTLRKGTAPDFAVIDEIAADNGLAITDITPSVGALNASTVYFVTTGELTGESYTLSFEENGGNAVPDITKIGGSLIGILPTPDRTGYTFEGWYTDAAFENLFEEKLLPKKNMTLYAKWSANEYTVSFHINGGTSETPADMTVVYGSTYAKLPVIERSGYGFIGWFTEAEGGTQVKETDNVKITQNQTLYAHWKELEVIDRNVFDFGAAEINTYSKGQTYEPVYRFNAGAESFTKDSFTFTYMRQGDVQYINGLPINAGTYDVRVTREADNNYAKFEQFYQEVVIIKKAVRTIENAAVRSSTYGYDYIDVILKTGEIDDLHADAKITYNAARLVDGVPEIDKITSETASVNETARLLDLVPGMPYSVQVAVTEDPNYEDAVSKEFTGGIKTRDVPEEFWPAGTSYGVQDTNDKKTYYIRTAEQLSTLMHEVNDSGKTFLGYKFVLKANLDMSKYKWIPIGTSTHKFMGSFDGQNHTIKGLFASFNDCAGLFGYVISDPDKSEGIHDLTINDSYFDGAKAAGSIAAVAAYSLGNGYMKIYNCTNGTTSTVKSKYACGGIVGKGGNGVSDKEKGMISGCVNNGRISGTGNVGGIVGALNSNIVTNCINRGPVFGKGSNTGGIVGSSSTNNWLIVNCANLGNVSGLGNVGGISGSTNDIGSVYNCYSAGTVTGTGEYVGAVIGNSHVVNRKTLTMQACYYLEGSAARNGENVYAVGKATGSYEDGYTNGLLSVYASSFNAEFVILQGAGMPLDLPKDLLNMLNKWRTYNNNDTNYGYTKKWVKGSDGYPKF